MSTQPGFVWNIDSGMPRILALALIRVRRWHYQDFDPTLRLLPIFVGEARGSAATKFGDLAGYTDTAWFTNILSPKRDGIDAHSRLNRWFKSHNVAARPDRKVPPSVEVDLEFLTPVHVNVLLDGNSATAKQVDWIESLLAAPIDNSFPPQVEGRGIPVKGRLPSVGPEFDHRDQELGILNQVYEDPKIRVCEIVANGGDGKSALARWWLRSRDGGQSLREAQVFSWSFPNQGDLREARQSPWEFMSGFAAALNVTIRESMSAQDTVDVLMAGLQRTPTLLILDGLEVLLTTAAEFSMGGTRKSKSTRWKTTFHDPSFERLLNELAGPTKGRVCFCLITSQISIAPLLGKCAAFSSLSLPPLPIPSVPPEVMEFLDEKDRWLLEHAKINILTIELRKAAPDDEKRSAQRVEIDTDRHRRALELTPDFQYEVRSAVEGLGDTPALCLLYIVSMFRAAARWDAIMAVIHMQLKLEALRPDEPATVTKHPFAERWSSLSDAEWEDARQALLKRRLVQPSSHGDIPMQPMIRRCVSDDVRHGMPEFWVYANRCLCQYYAELPEKKLPDTLTEMKYLFEACWHGCQAGDYKRTFEEIAYPRISRRNEAYIVNELGASQYALSVLSWFTNDAENFPGQDLDEPSRVLIIHGCALCLRYVDRLDEALRVEKIAWERMMLIGEHSGALPVSVNYIRTLHIFGRLKETPPVIGSVIHGMVRGVFTSAKTDVPQDFIPQAIGYCVSATALALACRGKVKAARSALGFAKVLCRANGSKNKYLMPGLGAGFHALTLLELGDWKSVLAGIQADEVAPKVHRFTDTGMYNYIEGRARAMAAVDRKGREQALKLVDMCIERASKNFQWWHAVSLLEKGRILVLSNDYEGAMNLFEQLLDKGHGKNRKTNPQNKQAAQFAAFGLVTVDALLGLARCYASLGEFVSAEECAHAAMKKIDETGYELRRKEANSFVT